MKNYIKHSKRTRNIERRMGNVLVIEKDALPSEVSIEKVMSLIKNSIPENFISNVDSIYIGEFEHLKKRDLNAVFSDGAIYVTNNQSSEDDMAEDIVHELAHALEDKHGYGIYSDGKIESEFRGKRERLYFLLKEEGYDVELSDFLNLEYSRAFDNFLYKEVGYPMMSVLTVNLFYSPYGATSLSEYFANSFEAYFYHRDISRVKQISPNIFAILEKIGYNKEEQ